MGTCPLAVHLYQEFYFMHDIQKLMELLLIFENKKEKTVLDQEAFATQIPHSGNQDSALNLTPLNMRFVLTFRCLVLTDGIECRDTSPGSLGHFHSHPMLLTKIVV